jgi:hypothetical protein
MNRQIASSLLLAAGLLLVVLGIVFRGTQVHAAGATGALSCGSVASPDSSQATHDGYVAEFTGTQAGVLPSISLSKVNEATCADAISTRTTWTWVLIGAGVVALAGALFTFTYSPAGRRPATA